MIDPPDRQRASLPVRSADTHRVLGVLILGENGAYIVSQSGNARSAALSELLDALSAQRMTIVRLNSTARPHHVQGLLAQAAKTRQTLGAAARSIVVVNDAEQLRDDTLSVLNEVAGMLANGKLPCGFCWSAPRWCTDLISAGSVPSRADQCWRMVTGLASRVMRLSTWTVSAISPL